MVQGKQDKDRHVAVTLRCTKCGETFPHVFKNDECLNCGARSWEAPPKRVRTWAMMKGRVIRP